MQISTKNLPPPKKKGEVKKILKKMGRSCKLPERETIFFIQKDEELPKSFSKSTKKPAIKKLNLGMQVRPWHVTVG